MRAFANCLLLFLSIAALCAAEEKLHFTPQPAASYPNHQTGSKVTIGAMAYHTPELARSAFGKINPYEHGVLPVLVVIQNESKQTISLETMRVEYVAPDRSRIEATPVQDLAYLQSPKRPNPNPSPLPIPLPRKSKNALVSIEILTRAFSAKVLPPGESASGFFYFQTGFQSQSQLYITGIREAISREELFYFELPLQP